MEEQIRDFKGIWIPKEIWLDDRLSALEKTIFAEIDSLDVNEGCYASNSYLAIFCHCTEKTISNSIKKLIDLGYLKVSKFDGRRRYLQSRLEKISMQTRKNFYADQKIFPTININNNIDNNIDNKYIIDIVDYLNLKTNQNYKSTTPKTRTLIKSRLKEKFTIEDFKKVIDIKCEEWLNTDMEKYLRPETLFGTKFESYLNQKSKLPKWFDKEPQERKRTDEEQRQLEELIRGY